MKRIHLRIIRRDDENVGQPQDMLAAIPVAVGRALDLGECDAGK